MIDFLIAPFTDFAFMKRALVAAVILSFGGAPLGVFMMLRRMTLVGDSLSHAILPGIAVGFLVAGLSLWAMTIGGLVAAILVACAAVLLVRTTQLKEDAAFTLLYLLSLGVGVTLVSLRGSGVDLLHLLFGNILAIDASALWLVTGASCLSLLVVAAFYRQFVIDGFDPDFLAVVGRGRKTSGWTGQIFYILLMINLVAAFQAFGTLMALGLMILPALASRFWVRSLDAMIFFSAALSIVSAYLGLLISFHAGTPSGPAIVLVAGGFAGLSALMGRIGSVKTYFKA